VCYLYDVTAAGRRGDAGIGDREWRLGGTAIAYARCNGERPGTFVPSLTLLGCDAEPGSRLT